MITSPAKRHHPIESLMARVALIRSDKNAFLKGFRKKVRSVVVLASSSRGGSSLTAEFLKHSHSMLHFKGEINPFFRMSGYAFPFSGSGSDALDEEHLFDPDLLETLLAKDIGQPFYGVFGEREEVLFAKELHFRLSMQWPFEVFCPFKVSVWVKKTMLTLVKHYGWRPFSFENKILFHLIFLKWVQKTHPRVSPWYYDLPDQLIEAHFPHQVPVNTPPSEILIEEPPFITIEPWHEATLADLDKPVLIKTPSNVFRLGFLRAFFPNADFRVIHLTRNAAASINGLYDGWQFRGFFSHELKGKLRIKSYSDQFLGYGKSWWKFDLPPCWEHVVAEPLLRVCQFQWLSAHRAVLDFVEQNRVNTCRVQFEALIGSEKKRVETIRKLFTWLNIPVDQNLEKVLKKGLPPIMATRPPEKARWRKRYDAIYPLVRQPEILGMMRKMGYCC